MADIEFEVPGLHEPCRETLRIGSEYANCLSPLRAIRYVPRSVRKIIVCGNGHTQRPDNPFVAASEFEEGGTYAGIVPPEFLRETQRTTESRWKIPADAIINELEIDRCVECDVPPFEFFGGPDISHAWSWLEEYGGELAVAIRRAIAQNPRASFSDWPALIDSDVQKRIRERLDMSRLEVEHAVPRNVGDEVWGVLTPGERRVLQLTLLVKFCRRCIAGKSSALPTREAVESWYAKTYFDGDRQAAAADAERWRIIGRTLATIYERRAVS